MGKKTVVVASTSKVGNWSYIVGIMRKAFAGYKVKIDTAIVDPDGVETLINQNKNRATVFILKDQFPTISISKLKENGLPFGYIEDNQPVIFDPQKVFA